MFVAGGILLRGWFYAVFCCPGRFPCTELRDAWKGRVGRIRYLFIGQTIKDGKARIYLGPWPSHGLSFTGVQDGGRYDTVTVFLGCCWCCDCDEKGSSNQWQK